MKNVIPRIKKNNRPVHKQFLKNLQASLPPCATPVIVTDAGFQAPCMVILLLIAAIATFAASLTGLIITSMGKAAHFQAHSAKFTRALSIIDLGREVFPVFSKTQFLNTYNLLRQMMIDTQLAKGVYE